VSISSFLLPEKIKSKLTEGARAMGHGRSHVVVIR